MIRDHGSEPGHVERIGLGVGFALWMLTSVYYSLEHLIR